jgi:hypothetical protein
VGVELVQPERASASPKVSKIIFRNIESPYSFGDTQLASAVPAASGQTPELFFLPFQ